ncbi:MAG: transposase, partial [Proteobacteria bacterium]|nr:transposase [Pseudomonadota bacterium]
MIGIDVSKASLSVCAWDGEAQRVRWELEVANTEAGVRGLLARTEPGEPWALEPTGRYSEGVARLGLAQGRQVVMALPRAAKHFLTSVHP